MDLSNEVLSRLRLCTDAQVVRAAFEVLTRRKEEAAVDTLQGASHEMKQGYGALVALTVEAARGAHSVASVAAVLKEHGAADAVVQAFGQYYKECVGAIRDQLRETHVAFPSVVDAEWRLDYLIKSREMARQDEPSYLIRLKLDDGGVPADTQFTANLQQLQDLVATLKEAVSDAQRVAQQ